jgi:hypothetical protein
MDVGVRPDDVVVGQDVLETEILDALPVPTEGTHVGADLGLREDDTDAHDWSSWAGDRKVGW